MSQTGVQSSPEKSPIVNEIDKIDDRLEAIWLNITVLQNRLESCLTPSNPQPISEVDPKLEEIAMLRRLNNIHGKAVIINDALADVLLRLAL